MSHALSESAIVRAAARQAARLITRRVIRELQQMSDTLSGADSGLRSTWDEICVQAQGEESWFWDAYDQTVRSVVAGHVATLSKHEQEAIWLQTDAGGEWDCEAPDNREDYPVRDSDIIEYLVSEYVYDEAGRWTNARIRAYIEGSYED